jgi:hypothetical protein
MRDANGRVGSRCVETREPGVQFRRPAQGQSTRSFLKPARRENGSLPRNVSSTGSGPQPSLLSFGGWDHYSLELVVSSIALHSRSNRVHALYRQSTVRILHLGFAFPPTERSASAPTSAWPQIAELAISRRAFNEWQHQNRYSPERQGPLGNHDQCGNARAWGLLLLIYAQKADNNVAPGFE